LTFAPPGSSATEHPQLTLFSALWASATLFHLASYDRWMQTPLTALTAVAAAALLLRPSSAGRLAALALAQIADVYTMAPDVSNHWFVTFFVNATVLLAMLAQMARQRTGRVNASEFFERFAPAVRVEVLAFYFFTVFHKLNTSFLDPALSCGAVFYRRQAEFLGFLPSGAWAEVGNIWLTLLVEAAIPILLWTSPTRSIGILVAMAFHGVIGLNPLSGFYNFSSMIFAVLSLFLSPDVAERLLDRWKRAVRAMPLLGWVAFTVLAAAIAVAGWVGLVWDQWIIAWIVYAGICLWAFVIEAFKRQLQDTTPLFRIRGAQWVVPPLLVLNGITPYLGLKTENAFAMFSNLRTEGGVSNHLIAPAGAQLFRYQDDLVQVTSSSNRLLTAVARDGLLIPYFEVRSRPRASVAYRLNGGEVRWDRVADDPRYPGPVPVLLRKALAFRPVDPGPDQRCRH
jgi:hypothetical protein